MKDHRLDVFQVKEFSNEDECCAKYYQCPFRTYNCLFRFFMKLAMMLLLIPFIIIAPVHGILIGLLEFALQIVRSVIRPIGRALSDCTGAGNWLQLYSRYVQIKADDLALRQKTQGHQINV